MRQECVFARCFCVLLGGILMAGGTCQSRRLAVLVTACCEWERIKHMELVVNGEPFELDEGCSLSILMDQYGVGQGIVAVARNCEFVPRSAYESTRIEPGDKIEIVAPMQGG